MNLLVAWTKQFAGVTGLNNLCETWCKVGLELHAGSRRESRSYSRQVSNLNNDPSNRHSLDR